MSEQMEFDNGKYTVIADQGKLTALRYGEPWRELTGDNLVHCMLDTTLKQQEAPEDFKSAAKKYQEYKDQVELGDDTMAIIKFEEFQQLLNKAHAKCRSLT